MGGTVLHDHFGINVADLPDFQIKTEQERLKNYKSFSETFNLTSETELPRSNELIADIIKNMPDGLFVLDNKWRFMFVNKKAEELLLKTREKLLGKVFWDIFPKLQGTLLELNYQKAMNDYIPITFDFLSSLRSDAWYQITVFPCQFGLSVYYKDITGQKISRKKLKEAHEQKVSILENMTDCFFAIDRNLQFTYVNHGAEIVFGKSRDQILGKKMTEVYRVNDTALLHYHEVISEKRSVTFEVFSKSSKWFEVSAYPTETGVSCYFRDITNRKIAEKTLRQSEEKFSKAFHGGPIMMTLATIEEGKFIDANEALCSGTGYTREELIGRTTKELNFFVDKGDRQERGKQVMEQY